MELVFALLAQIKEETLQEVLNPSDDRRTAFHYGRVHGILFCLAMLDERLRGELEATASREAQMERNFDR